VKVVVGPLLAPRPPGVTNVSLAVDGGQRYPGARRFG
jgi:hypothetical protein